MKKFFISAILLATATSVYASPDLNKKSVCSDSAKKHLTAIMSVTQTAEDMKVFEIRKVDVTKIEKGLNGEPVETYEMIFGYKAGELSWENYEVQLVERASTIPGEPCLLISYENKF